MAKTTTYGQWSKETEAIVDKLCLFDDDFMSKVFENNIPCTALLIRTILGSDEYEIVKVQVQRELRNKKGYRNIRLDILAKDSKGKLFDIEIQQKNRGAAPQRARFYSARIDSRLLKSGKHFESMRESYVIMITRNDIYKKGIPIYHIERNIEELNQTFADGSHIIYVNGAYKDENSEIGRLIHDLRCSNPEDVYNKELREEIAYYKSVDGGRDKMCQLVEEYGDRRAAAVRAEMEELLVESKKEVAESKKEVEELEAKLSVALGMLKKLGVEGI